MVYDVANWLKGKRRSSYHVFPAFVDLDFPLYFFYSDSLQINNKYEFQKLVQEEPIIRVIPDN